MMIALKAWQKLLALLTKQERRKKRIESTKQKKEAKFTFYKTVIFGCFLARFNGLL